MARRVSYPHPVLGHGDDITAGAVTGAITAELRPDRTVRVAVTSLEVGNRGIAELMSAKKAAFSIQLSCPRTYFRRCWMTTDSSTDVIVPSASLSEVVSVRVEVVATAPIRSYRPTNQNEDYGDASFSIERGAILGLGPERSIWIRERFDPSTGSVSSFMKVREGLEEEGCYTVDFDDRKIYIDLPKKDWKRYPLWKKSHAGVLHAALVLPVLASAIERIKADRDEDREALWFIQLSSIIAAKKLQVDDDTDALTLAQKLLDSPFSRAGTAIEAFASGDSE